MTEVVNKEFVKYDFEQEQRVNLLLEKKYYEPLIEERESLVQSKEYKEALEKFKNEYTDAEVEEYKADIEQAKKEENLIDDLNKAINKVMKGTRFEQEDFTVYFDDQDGYGQSRIDHQVKDVKLLERILNRYFESLLDYKPLKELEAKMSLTRSAIESVVATVPNDTPVKVAVEETEELLKYLELI